MTSALETKLSTNYVPSKDEMVQLKKGLKKSEDTLYHLDEEIRQLQNRFDQLTTEQERLTKRVEGYKGMLAPARRLLPEMLQEIFYHTLPTAHNSVMSRNEPPLVLGRVCRQWRQVALATPRIWASIHIVIPSDNPYMSDAVRDDSTLLSAITSWLSRSGILPLSVSLWSPLWSSDPTIPTNPKVLPFLHVLTNHRSRWKSIDLRIQNFDWAEFFDMYDAVDLPLLEEIHIEGIHVLRDSPEAQTPPAFAAASRTSSLLQAPRLQSLSMPRFGRRILQLPIRWRDLTELKLSSNAYPLQDITTGLLLCPNLESCSICLSDWDNAEDWPTPPKMTLSRLRALSITDDMTIHDVSLLLEHLYTPELAHLSYTRRGALYWGENDANLGERLVDCFASFLSRLVHPLEELELGAESLSDAHVVGILELVPGLKRLSLRSFGRVRASGWGCRGFGWPSPPSFSLVDRPLSRLTPSHTKNDHPPIEGATILDVVDSHLKNEVDSGSEPLPVPDSPPGWSSPVTPHIFRDPWETLSNKCLCPKLEVFHCTGAMFSDPALLDFLRARSQDHHQFGVAHLRRVGIQFVAGRARSDDTIREIKELEYETGIVVCLTYYPVVDYYIAPPIPTGYSPYQGLDDVMKSENFPHGYFGFR